MKGISLLTICSLAAGMSFAAEEASPSLVQKCNDAIAKAKASLPEKASQAKLTVAEAMGNAKALEVAFEDDPESAETASLAYKCGLYAEIIQTQGENYAVRAQIAETWEKRIATARSIEAIQEQIAVARGGKVTDLTMTNEAMKAQEAKLQEEMKMNKEKFQAEAAEREAALKAANDREADLQKKLEEEQAALAAERAKAEERQKEAMNKLNELQSKLIQVSKDARGIILSMSDILFDVNKATLKADLKTSLAKVAGILSVYQQFNVSIEGNTDNTGSAEHNMKLSEQRATNVMNFLVEQGIEASRLTAKGLGMTMPIADNSTKEGRQKNRRVDLVIQDRALQQGASQESAPTPAPAEQTPANN
ncbi:MAG: OmpA family protein [Fibrobacteraceae bacterium]|nr:OmpA family protein [Fibrobacteraceae bacterium]